MTISTVERPRPTAYAGCYLPADLRHELERLAQKSERSISGELRVAIASHVAANREPAGRGREAS
jgi:hypothetical protein